MTERNEQNKFNYSLLTFTKEQPSSTSRKNEDALLTLKDGNKIVGFIVDGGTALSSITLANPEAFNGYFAANTALEGVKSAFPESKSAKQLLIAANSEIGSKLKNAGIDPDQTDSEFLPTCGGASVIWVNKNHDRTSIAQIGDTAVIVILKNGKVEVAIKPSVNNEDVLAYRLANYLMIAGHITIQDALNTSVVTNTLVLGRHKENLPDGYGALNGKSYAERYMTTKDYRTSKIYRIIAVTDGASLPVAIFDGEPDWKLMANEIAELGPEQYYQDKVFKIKESDPELTKYPRFKKHDDASILEIVFDQN